MGKIWSTYLKNVPWEKKLYNVNVTWKQNCKSIYGILQSIYCWLQYQIDFPRVVTIVKTGMTKVTPKFLNVLTLTIRGRWADWAHHIDLVTPKKIPRLRPCFQFHFLCPSNMARVRGHSITTWTIRWWWWWWWWWGGSVESPHLVTW